MTTQQNGEEVMQIDPKNLDAASLKTINSLIVQCIHFQRRLESAILYINDPQILRRTSLVMNDLRAYRRVLVENLTATYTPDIYKESIRIVEKAMSTIASSTDQICLIAGKECIYSE
uniref:PhoU domain-containing protein n=1 Tax=Caenorhabditis tropicalis TaxID=1561998 RepID=A0A1I7TB11_9PELO